MPGTCHLQIPMDPFSNSKFMLQRPTRYYNNHHHHLFFGFCSISIAPTQSHAAWWDHLSLGAHPHHLFFGFHLISTAPTRSHTIRWDHLSLGAAPANVPRSLNKETPGDAAAPDVPLACPRVSFCPPLPPHNTSPPMGLMVVKLQHLSGQQEPADARAAGMTQR